MSIIQVQNRQKRAWIIPGVMGKNGAFVYRPVNLAPGEKAMVQSDHWESVKKGNRVIEALLTSRFIVASAAGKETRVDPDELANPKAPAAPADLTEKDDRVRMETKTEVKEITLNDAPTEGKGPAR